MPPSSVSAPALCPPCGKSNVLEPHSGHGEAQSSPPRFSFTPRGRFEHFRHVKGSSKERPWIVRVENVLKPSAASRCQGKAVETSLGLLPNPFRVRERGFRLFRGCKSHLAFCTSHSALLSCPLNLFSCLAPRALVYHAKGVTRPLCPPCGESIIAGQFGHCPFWTPLIFAGSIRLFSGFEWIADKFVIPESSLPKWC